MNILTLAFANIEIADGVNTELTGDLATELQHAIQDGTPIGAAVRTFFDRLTQSESVTFIVNRQHGKLSRRLWWQLLGIRQWPGKGTLVLTLTEGSTVHTFTCLGAAKSGIQTKSQALSQDMAFSFQADNWLYTTSDAEDGAAGFLGGRPYGEAPTGSRGGRWYGEKAPLTVLGGRAYTST
jgi:hypothetical protein